MHPVEQDLVFFGRTGLNRLDDPRGEYGLLYAAEDAFGAFIESFGRAPGRNVVSWEKLRSRPLSSIEAERLVRLVDLRGGGRDLYRRLREGARVGARTPRPPF
jgi:hypothetical protein